MSAFDDFLRDCGSDCVNGTAGPILPQPSAPDPAKPLLELATLLRDAATDLETQATAALDRDEVLAKFDGVEARVRLARREYVLAMGGRR